MDKKELIQRLRQIQSSVYSIHGQTEKQKEDISFIVADLMEIIWELETETKTETENKATEG